MSIRTWLRTWWLRIPEPRDISIAYTVVYAGMLFTGIVTLAAPPRTISTEIGPVLMAGIAWFLIAGAVLCMGAGAREVWLVERIGLAFLLTALVCYSGLIFTLHFTSGGSRLTQFGIVLFGAMGVFVVRYLMIRGYTYRPRG